MKFITYQYKLILLHIFLIVFSNCASTNNIPKYSLSKKYRSYKAPKKIKADTTNINENFQNQNFITLQKALHLTLSNNPDIRLAAWNIKTAESEIKQSKLIENPEAELELENFGIKAISIKLGQLIELGGKRSSRIKMANLEKNNSIWDYEILKMDKIIEVSKHYIDILIIQKKIEKIQDTVTFGQNALDISKTRHKAGAGSMIEVLQAQKELDLLLMENEKEKNSIKLLYQKLALFWSDKKCTFTNALGTLNLPETIPEIENFITKITNTPEITRWIVNYKIKQMELKRAGAHAFPDLNINTGYTFEPETKEHIIGLGLILTLPIFNRNQGEIEKSKIELHKSKIEKIKIENSILNDLNERYTEFQNAFIGAKTLQEKIIINIRKAYTEARKFYKIGKISSIELLSLQNELISSEIRYIEALGDFYKTKFDLELLFGEEIILTKGDKK